MYQFVTESSKKKIIAAFLDQYDDLATLEGQYAPRLQLCEY